MKVNLFEFIAAHADQRVAFPRQVPPLPKDFKDVAFRQTKDLRIPRRKACLRNSPAAAGAARGIADLSLRPSIFRPPSGRDEFAVSVAEAHELGINIGDV